MISQIEQNLVRVSWSRMCASNKGTSPWHEAPRGTHPSPSLEPVATTPERDGNIL